MRSRIYDQQELECVVLGYQIGNGCVVPCLSENTYLLEGEDGLIRRGLIWLENWAMDDESFFLSFGKFMLMVVVFVAMIAAPIIWWVGRGGNSEYEACLASGKAWAIVGSHPTTTPVLVGKVIVPIHSRATDYGCVERR
jgi:hypothetical protein